MQQGTTTEDQATIQAAPATLPGQVNPETKPEALPELKLDLTSTSSTSKPDHRRLRARTVTEIANKFLGEEGNKADPDVQLLRAAIQRDLLSSSKGNAGGVVSPDKGSQHPALSPTVTGSPIGTPFQKGKPGSTPRFANGSPSLSAHKPEPRKQKRCC